MRGRFSPNICHEMEAGKSCYFLSFKILPISHSQSLVSTEALGLGPGVHSARQGAQLGGSGIVPETDSWVVGT